MRATGPGSLPVVLAGLEPLTALGVAHRRGAGRGSPPLGARRSLRSRWRARRPLRPRGQAFARRRGARDDRRPSGAPARNALLLGVLDSTIDRCASRPSRRCSGCGTIDDWTIERLGRILLGHSPASIELRVAAASALVLAPLESRARVVAFIQERLVPTAAGARRVACSARRSARRRTLASSSPWRARSSALDPAGARSVLDRLLVARPELRTDIEGFVVAR